MSDQQLIDDHRVSTLQLRVLAICFLLNMLDGMDVLAISFAAPLMAEDWSIAPQALGIVFSSALVGMAIGAVFISPYTDVIGRRRMILGSLLVIALGTLATASAESVTQLTLLRLVAGIGIGSMLASLTSMVSEYSSDKHRNLAILILHAAYPIGAILAGFIASWILPSHGWRPLFILAGLSSLAVLPLVWLGLPESLEFLVRKQPARALDRINRILNAMAMPALNRLPDKPETGHNAGGLSRLFRNDLKAPTLMLWSAFMMSFATLYFLFSWVVKLAMEAGLALQDAMYAGISLNLGAFVGSISLGYLSNRFGLKRTIALFFLAGAVFSVLYGNLHLSVAITLALIFTLMLFVQGGFTGLYAVAARLYPTEIRTTGVGWAIGAGRIGAIVGPAIAGMILGAGVPLGWIFVIFAIPLIIAGVAISRLSSQSVS